MIDEVVAIVLGVIPVVLGIVTVAVGVSGAVGRSIASEDAIRSGMSASYANLSQNGYG